MTPHFSSRLEDSSVHCLGAISTSPMASSPTLESHPQLPTSPQQLGTPENKELPAPAGWQKKIASTKSGGTPRRGAVYFIAPDGEEIKSKRSLEGYLKSHPGGPSVTEFDWSTGETPRRSSRLSTKTPLDSPESGSGRRRVRRKVAVEDDSPQDKGRVGLDGAPSAKADEVMEDVDKVKDCEAVEKMESDINEEVEKIAEKTDEHKIVECVSIGAAVEKMESDINEEAEKIAEKTDEHKIVECVSIGAAVEKMESDDINEEVEKITEKTDEHKIVECVSEAETETAQTVERLPEVENGEGKVADAVLPIENGPEEEPVKQEEFGVEKVETDEGKPEKLQSTMEEADAVLPRENGPEEELVKEVGGEKFRTDEGKPAKSESTMEGTPMVEVNEVVQCDEKLTNKRKIDTFEEQHKQEDAEKATNGVSQSSENPEASRPIGFSV